jgi:hypothetical protein
METFKNWDHLEMCVIPLKKIKKNFLKKQNFSVKPHQGHLTFLFSQTLPLIHFYRPIKR